MRIEIGSKTILYDWHDLIKRRLNNDVKNQIAENLSSGLTYGQFHYSFNGITDMTGWWIIKEHVET